MFFASYPTSYCVLPSCLSRARSSPPSDDKGPWNGTSCDILIIISSLSPGLFQIFTYHLQDKTLSTMAPGILSNELPVREAVNKTKTSYPSPLELSGALEGFAREDTTPVMTSIISKKPISSSLKHHPGYWHRVPNREHRR